MEPRRWNGTWPDGTRIVPAPGMLADTLIDMCEETLTLNGELQYDILLEDGIIVIDPNGIEQPYYSGRHEPDGAWFVTPERYEAHMRDMQKYGALLAYCAQPGWEARNA